MAAAPSHQPPVSLARLAGAALGTMAGDALGMPVEGWPAGAIAARYGWLERMVEGRARAGSYTDDTQMMIGILETLAARGTLDPEYLAGRFAANFEPQRGYGARIGRIVARIDRGMAWDEVGTDSFGNGGAMRVGVLGVFYADREEDLVAAAYQQCSITHQHPRGLAGAVAQAVAVGLACRQAFVGHPRDQAEFVEYVARRAEAVDVLVASRLRALPWVVGMEREELREALSSAYECDVTAAETVPPALGCFLWAQDLPSAIAAAVNLGGDTDTLGAMAGALAGAYWGVEAIPAPWFDALENGDQGRDYLLSLCPQALDQRQRRRKT